MKLRTLAVLILAVTAPALAQEKGYWRAASGTAKSVTGDVAFSGTKVTIDFASFTIADIRPLKPAEIAAAFDADASASLTGTLFRVSIPAGQKFLHKTTLCGAEETQWIATYVTGRSLQLAFFSGSAMPVFTMEAISGSSDLCGLYSYTR
jgi:hypothetical protein